MRKSLHLDNAKLFRLELLEALTLTWQLEERSWNRLTRYQYYGDHELKQKRYLKMMKEISTIMDE